MAGLPAKFGKYIVKSELGRGAMGVVYLAEDPRLHRPVALKTMSPTVAGDPELLKRFYREAESAGQLRHPNIVTIYDIDEANGIPFIAMEFLEGNSLEKLIRSRRDIPTFRKLDYMIQASRGLHYAHTHGIVHRDVKPANIVVLEDGVVKIVDFGIARITDAAMTRTGIVLGTPMYMSPEQIRGKPVDARSDIFSAGVILYELLTYANPFRAEDVPTIIFKILNDPIPSLSSILENCPPALQEVVNKALARERDQRYQTAEDLAFDLQKQAEYLKRHMMDVFVQEGQRHFEEGNLTLARESLQKVLELDSRHDLAKGLLVKVQEEIQSRQQAEKIEQGLQQAQKALEGKLFDEAIDLLDEVLRADPSNAQAAQAKKLAVEQRERARAIALYLEHAEDTASQGDLWRTRASVESLLALDPQNPRGLQLLEWVKKQILEQERLAQVRKHLEAAQAQLAERNYASALELLQQAHNLDPVNLEVESLLRSARESQEREQRRKLLEQRVANIQETLTRENFEEAVQAADEALRDFPDDSQIIRLRAQAARQAEVHRKRRYVDEQLQAARDCFQKNDFSAALAILDRGLAAVPNDSRLASYLRTVREAQETARLEALRQEATRQANDWIRAKDFSRATRVLETALSQIGQSPELEDLLQFSRDQLADQQLQEQVQKVVARAKAHLKEGQYDEAVRVLEQAQRETPSSEISDLLRATFEQRQALLQQRVTGIQESLGREKFEEAIRLADEALQEAPDHSQIVKLRAQAVRLAEVQKKRRQVDEQLQAARDCFQKNDFAGAIAVLERGLAAVPNDTRLVSYLKTVRDAQEVARLENLRQEGIRQANDLIRAKDFPGAIRVLERVLSQAGQSPELDDLLQFSRDQYAEQQLQEQVQKVLASAQALLKDERYDEAVRVLEQAGRETPSSQISDLLGTAYEHWQDYEQRRNKLLKQAQDLLRAGQPTKAVAALDAAPKGFFKAPEFQRMYKECRDALDRTNAIRQARELVQQCLASEDWPRAEKVLQEALRAYPGEADLLAVQKGIQESQLRARQTRLGKVLEDAKVAFGQLNYGETERLLSAVDWEASGFPDLAKEAGALRAQAEERQRELSERQTIIQQIPPAITRPAAEGATPRIPPPQHLGGPPPPQPISTPTTGPAVPRTPERPSSRVVPTAPPLQAIPPAPARVISPPARRVPLAVWGLGAVLALGLAGFGVWRYMNRGVSVAQVGYARITSVPWSEVMSVKTQEGQNVEISGEKQTPLELDLPPGKYVIELKNGDLTETENVEVHPGKTARVNHVFSRVNVDALVDELLTKN